MRELAGLAPLSEEAFVEKYRSRYPGWQARPGALTAVEISDLGEQLEIASRVEWTRDYARLVAAHAAGLQILALTEHAPLPTGIGRRPFPTTSLVVAIDDTGFVLWWPSPTGAAGDLPRTARVWWDRWPVRAAVLHRT